MQKRPIEEWSKETYRLVPGESHLSRQIKVGELLKHKSGVLLFKCPACNALQFVAAVLSGPAEAPTVDRPITCGNGVCTRCAVTFRIRSGKVVPCEKEERPKTVIPEKLARAGVSMPRPLDAEDA